jgi:hypothetical protein
MPLLFFPLYYQLLEAYHPSVYTSPANISIVESVPTPEPKILGAKTTLSSPLPPIGGDGKIVNLILLGDSMIDTLKNDICQQSFQKYFPSTKFNLIKYGYGSTNIESALKRLTENTTYLGIQNPPILSQNPDIILIESFAYNNFGNSQSGIDRQSQSLKALTDTIKEKSPDTKILLAATIAPNSVVFGNGIKDMYFSALEKIEKSSTIKLYLQNLISFAQKNSFALADAFHPSLFGQNGLEQLISSSDHLHPSDLGTELFCDTVAKSITDNQLIN